MYYFSEVNDHRIDGALEQINDALFEEGFDILAEINLTATQKNIVSNDSRTNFVFVAFNPSRTFNILLANKTIRIVPPHSLIKQTNQMKHDSGSSSDPESIYDIQQDVLESINGEAKEKLDRVIDSLCNLPEN